MEIISELMIGLVSGGVIGGMIGFVLVRQRENREIIRWKKLANNARHDQVLSFRLRVREILTEARIKTAATNALLLKVHNGADLLTAGSKLFSSVVEESPESPVISSFHQWQEVKIDFPYIVMLQKLRERGFVFISTEKLESSILRRRYEAYQIKCSLIFMVFDMSDNGFYYVSYPSTKTEEELLSADDFVTLEMNKQALSRICKEFFEKGILS